MGEIELDGRVLIVKRMHVTYHLRLRPDQQEAAHRAHSVHADSCPVARTLRGCVDITTSLDMELLDEEPDSSDLAKDLP